MSGFHVILEAIVELLYSFEDSRGRTEYTTMEAYSSRRTSPKTPLLRWYVINDKSLLSENTTGMPGVGRVKQTCLVHWKRRQMRELFLCFLSAYCTLALKMGLTNIYVTNNLYILSKITALKKSKCRLMHAFMYLFRKITITPLRQS